MSLTSRASRSLLPSIDPQSRLIRTFSSVTSTRPTCQVQSRLPIAPGYRHFWSIFSKPTRTRAKTHDGLSQASELEQAIKAQDPKGRISFEHPSRHLSLSSLPDIASRFTLTFLLELTKSVIDRARNQPVYGYPNRTIWSETGFSLAAVTKDHFADGLLLPDDLREGITSVGLDNYTPHLPNIITTLNVPVTYGSQNAVPPFAFGPPAFGPSDIGVLAELQATDYPKKIWREIISVKEASVIVYAVPTYRYLLEIMCANNQRMILTNRGTFVLPPSSLKSSPDYLGPEPVHERNELFGYHEQLLAENIERTPSGRLTWYRYARDDVDRFRRAVLKVIEQERQKGGAGCDWTQNGILGAISGTDGMGAEEALEIGDEYMLQQRHSAPPSWVKAAPAQKPATLPSHLQRAAPEHKKAPKSKPTSTTSPDARSRAATPSPSQPSPPSSLPPASPAPAVIPDDAEVPYNKSALHASIPDPKGCYRALGIDRPDERLILPKYEKLMDRLIRQRFIKLRRELRKGQSWNSGSPEEVQINEQSLISCIAQHLP